jgi:hypothetical protein
MFDTKDDDGTIHVGEQDVDLPVRGRELRQLVEGFVDSASETPSEYDEEIVAVLVAVYGRDLLDDIDSGEIEPESVIEEIQRIWSDNADESGITSLEVTESELFGAVAEEIP